MKSRILPLAASLAIAATLAHTHAATQAVNWAASTAWVTANQDLRAGSGSTSLSNYVFSSSFSDTTALNPSSVGYTTPSGSVGTFYGGYKITKFSDTNVFTPILQVQQNTTSDRIVFNSNSGAFNSEVDALVYWKKSDFLNGLSSQTLSLDNTATGSISVNYGSGATTQTRFVVKSAGVFYISQTAQTNNTGGTYTLSFDPNTMWSIYDPTSDIELGTTSYSITSSALTDIQGVGVYMERTRTSNASSISLLSFQLDLVGTVSSVPEPATFAILAGAVVLGSVAYRRRRA